MTPLDEPPNAVIEPRFDRLMYPACDASHPASRLAFAQLESLLAKPHTATQPAMHRRLQGLTESSGRKTIP